MNKTNPDNTTNKSQNTSLKKENNPKTSPKKEEFGGPKGPEPTRYGDWQIKGRVSDF